MFYAHASKGEKSQDNGSYLVQVRAEYAGVSAIPEAERRPVVYNIGTIPFRTNSTVLETLFYGAPYDVFIIGILIAVGVLILFTVFLPQFLPFLAPSLHKPRSS